MKNLNTLFNLLLFFPGAHLAQSSKQATVPNNHYKGTWTLTFHTSEKIFDSRVIKI